MFLVTQFIGLYVVNQYTPKQIIVNGEIQNITPKIPYGFQPTGEISPGSFIGSFIVAFVFAVLLILILSKIKAELIIKIWFFIVVVISLGIVFNSIIPGLTQELFQGITYSEFFALIIAIPLAIYKVFKRNILIHNFTELLIYPGIAVIFVPLISQWNAITSLIIMISILILISGYDVYAVWHAGFMQRMAKYQIEQLKIFAGFFVPYLSKKQKIQIKKLSPKQLKTKRIKVSLAILGGGDVVFPLITAGVVMKFFGLIPALFVILGATLGLLYLFFFAEKGKFYPAMPFITAGIFIGMILSWIVSLI